MQHRENPTHSHTHTYTRIKFQNDEFGKKRFSEIFRSQYNRRDPKETDYAYSCLVLQKSGKVPTAN